MPVATRELRYADGDLSLHGFLATPAGVSVRAPGVLVVHEAFGLGDHAKRRAEMLAELGYVALAADMYGDGRTANTLDDALGLMRSVVADPDGWRARAGAAHAALCALPNVDPSRTGAIGFCFGGSTVIEFARSGAEVRAVVSFHGGLDTQRPEDTLQIRAKVLICTGAADPHVPRARVDEVADSLAAANVDFQINTYGGAQHSFTNPDADSAGIPGIKYDRRTDERSWIAMRDFFTEAFQAST